jgi:hypothetical protein
MAGYRTQIGARVFIKTEPNVRFANLVFPRMLNVYRKVQRYVCLRKPNLAYLIISGHVI